MNLDEYTVDGLAEYFTVLDRLKANGQVNMYAAAPVLAQETSLTIREARRILVAWMDMDASLPPKERAAEAIKRFTETDDVRTVQD